MVFIYKRIAIFCMHKEERILHSWQKIKGLQMFFINDILIVCKSKTDIYVCAYVI
jgi:hypothetical protein